jgi:hypothetical protein
MRITGNSLQTVIIYPLSGKVLEPVYIKCILQYNKLHLLFIPFPSPVINSIVIFNMDSTEHFKSNMCVPTLRERVFLIQKQVKDFVLILVPKYYIFKYNHTKICA